MLHNSVAAYPQFHSFFCGGCLVQHFPVTLAAQRGRRLVAGVFDFRSTDGA